MRWRLEFRDQKDKAEPFFLACSMTPALAFGRSSSGPSNPMAAGMTNPASRSRTRRFFWTLGRFEVGYIKFASPPAFLVVPFGHPIPPRPAEKMTNDAGQERNAYLPGFRSKVYNPKMFMDQDAYYFANNSKTVMDPMDAVHTLASQAPEYRAGKIPLIRVTGTTANKIEGPRGNNTYYAPVFVIAGWHDRPECFGPRTVALPGFSVPPVVATTAPTNGNGHAAPKAAPASAGHAAAKRR